MTRSRVLDLAGAFALATLLAVGSFAPGRSHAEASQDLASSASGDAAVCRADAPAGSLPARIEVQAHVAERLREAMLAVEAGEVVVLDGRGHGYRRELDPLAELAVLQAEARRQRQHR
jgi:hypothetical protein